MQLQSVFKSYFPRLVRLFLKPLVWGREKLIFSLPHDAVWEFGEDEVVKINLHYHIDQSAVPEVIDRYCRSYHLGKAFVCEVRNAELVGRNAVGVAQGHILMEIAVGRWFVLEKSDLPKVLFRQVLPIEDELDTVCSLVNDWSRNYFHWMTECLTRLEGLEVYQDKGNPRPILIVNAQPSAWQVESLKLLGYQPEDWIEWQMDRVKVKNLVIPSIRRYQELSSAGAKFTDVMSPAACQWLRKRIFASLNLEQQQIRPSKRVFISRARATSRRIFNEAEVMQHLSACGFRAYILEEMTFSEQVKLFAETEMVIAPHGAGLTNIMFCPEKTVVVELFGPPHYIRPDYFQLAHSLGLQYNFLMCDYQDYDLQVDIDQLRQLLSRYEIG